VLQQSRQGVLEARVRVAAGGPWLARQTMVNLLPLEEGEKINAMLPIKQYDDDISCSWRPARAR
jgi:hypothetical protein